MIGSKAEIEMVARIISSFRAPFKGPRKLAVDDWLDNFEGTVSRETILAALALLNQSEVDEGRGRCPQ